MPRQLECLPSEWLPTAAALLLLGSIAGCGIPHVTVEETELIEVSAADLRSLHAKTHTGQIEFRAFDSAAEELDESTIEILVEKRATGMSVEDAQEALDAIEIRSESSGDVHRIDWGWVDERSVWSAQVSYKIRLPSSLNVEAEAHTGAIVVRGVEGEITARAHNGKVVVDAMAPLVAETHNGMVDVYGTPPHVDLKSHNGMVRARLVGEGPLDGRIETHNGAVLVWLSPGVDVRIDAKTKNGHVATSLQDFDVIAVQEDNRTQWQGEIGDGLGELKLRTHNGAVRIENAANANMRDEIEQVIKSL